MAQGDNFISSQYSAWSFFLFAIACTGFTYEAISDHVLISNHFDDRRYMWSVNLLNCLLRTTGCAFVWMIWYTKKRAGHNRISQIIEPWLFSLENSYHILLMSSLAVRVVLEVTNGQCHTSGYSIHESYPCNDFQNAKIINPTSFLVLMFLPLLAFFLMRETYIESVAISWLISIGTIACCSLYMFSAPMLVPIFIYAYTSLLILYDSDRQNSNMVKVIIRLRATLEENEKLQEEAQAIELRAMIGNVAHDLKTPLTSLFSGIELIQDHLASFEQVHITKIADLEGQRSATADTTGIRACLQSMLSSGSFMTMCINRCLDYTKASKGLKLVPRPETIVIAEIMDFPARIMRDVQSSIEILILPFDAAICTHIITDKQWLTENLLCLLSNAVRYSNQGHVEVALHLIHDAGGEEEENEEVPKTTPSTVDSGPWREPPEQYLRFEVQDNGIGISEEVMQNLFSPFKQAQRLAGGTGLGLFSLAKRVEALKGQYGVMKRPDGVQGSLFWFSIPYRPDPFSSNSLTILTHDAVHLRSPRASVVEISLSPSTSHSEPHFFYAPSDQDDQPVPRPDSGSQKGDGAAVPPPPVLPPAPPSPRAVTTRALRVLVVDDAPTILKMTTMLLKKKGHTIEQAVNGAEALEMMTAHPAPYYDAVLIDLQMPIMDGIEAIRRLRAVEAKRTEEGATAQAAGGVSADDIEMGGAPSTHEPRSRHFIIAISANSDDVTTHEALSAGADSFIGKPFAYDSFANVVERHYLSSVV